MQSGAGENHPKADENYIFEQPAHAGDDHPGALGDERFEVVHRSPVLVAKIAWLTGCGMDLESYRVNLSNSDRTTSSAG